MSWAITGRDSCARSDFRVGAFRTDADDVYLVGAEVGHIYESAIRARHYFVRVRVVLPGGDRPDGWAISWPSKVEALRYLRGE